MLFFKMRKCPPAHNRDTYYVLNIYVYLRTGPREEEKLQKLFLLRKATWSTIPTPQEPREPPLERQDEPREC